jgi:hypothetical protein
VRKGEHGFDRQNEEQGCHDDHGRWQQAVDDREAKQAVPHQGMLRVADLIAHGREGRPQLVQLSRQRGRPQGGAAE